VSITITLVQMRCEKGAIDENLVATRDTYVAASARGADIVLFPEMSLTGYIDPTRRPEAVLSLDSPAVASLVQMTRDRSAMLLAGIVEANPTGKPFITQLAVEGGALRGVYRKVSIEEEEIAWFSPGHEFPLFSHRGLTFGVALCADVAHRDVFAAYAQQGASAVLLAAAPGLYGDQAMRNWRSGYDWWRGVCTEGPGEWSRELGLVIAIATQAGRTSDEDFPGGGYLFGPDGRCLAETSDWGEGVLDVVLPDAPEGANRRS